MKISARNKLKATITEVQIEGLISTLRLSLDKPAIITAVITRGAAEEMDIKKDDEIRIIVKPTEIFIHQLEKQ